MGIIDNGIEKCKNILLLFCCCCAFIIVLKSDAGSEIIILEDRAMPGGDRIEKRRNLIKEAEEKLGAGNEAEQLKELYDQVTRMKEEGIPLTEEAAGKLLESYEKCGIALKKKYDEARDQNGAGEEAGMYLRLIRKFSKDVMALTRYKNRISREENPQLLNIEEFYDKSRTRTVVLDGKGLSEMKKTGAGMNTRYMIPVAIEDEQAEGLRKADRVEMYFTESPSYDKNSDKDISLQDEERIAAEVRDKYPILEKWLTPGKSGMSRLYCMAGVLEETRIFQMLEESSNLMLSNCNNDPNKLLKTLRKALHEKSITDFDKMLKEIADLDKNKTKDPEESKRDKMEAIFGLLDYTGKILKARFVEQTHRAFYMDHTSDIGGRNALMSDVAELLGCSDIVAFSEKMNVWGVEEGKLVKKKGVAMMPAVGEDIAKISLFGNYVKMDKTKVELAAGVNKKIAALQILDYICGNVDRHTANALYQYDKKGNFTGLQGIDNDLAFLAYPERTNGFTSFENLRVIPKSMADKISALSPDAFTMIMQGYGLSDREIKAAVKRLNVVKNGIKKSEKVYADMPPGKLDMTVPKVVPDEELDLYSVYGQLSYINPRPGMCLMGANLFGKLTYGNNLKEKLRIAVSDACNKIQKNDFAFRNAFLDQGKGSLHDFVRNMDALLKEAPDEQESLLNEDILQDPEKKDAAKAIEKSDKDFRALMTETDQLLKDSRLIDPMIDLSSTKIYVDPREPSGSPLYVSKEMSEDKVQAIKKKMLQREKDYVKDPKGKVEGKKYKKELAEAINNGEVVPFDPRDVVETETYKKLNSALEKANEYLVDQADTADKYQTLQMDIAEAEGKEKENLLKKMETFKKSREFKKYMTALKTRDSLSEQLERYVDMQRESFEMCQARDKFNNMRSMKEIDPFDRSPLHYRAIEKQNNGFVNLNMENQQEGEKKPVEVQKKTGKGVKPPVQSKK